jgi:hypothetical protein
MTYRSYPYDSYADYIAQQTVYAHDTESRTLARRKRYKNEGTFIKEVYPLAASLICIGARHGFEVQCFREVGFRAIGIDLYETKDVTKCDMSKMPECLLLEPWRPIDVAYMSHSLEHCLDVPGLMNGLEWLGVHILYIVVPRRISLSRWDCTLFDFMHPASPAEDILGTFPGWDLIWHDITIGKARKYLLKKKGSYGCGASTASGSSRKKAVPRLNPV